MSKRLEDASEEELEKELAKRQKNRVARPTPRENIDFSNLVQECEDVLDELDKEGFIDEDTDHYMYEAIMTKVYGDAVWDYINQKDR
jgi:SOS response regulatory protein OraA/RecX